jgi:hypothetical protein
MAVSYIGGRNRRKPPTCRKSLTNFITYWCIDAWTGFELTTLVVIGTDCMGSHKSNYLTITAMTTPYGKSNGLRVVWWQMILLVFLIQKTVQLFIFSIFWLWAWRRALWKLFQKSVVHTRLDIYVCIVKFKMQIEKLHIYALFWRTKIYFQRRTNMVWSSKMLWIQIWTTCKYRW